MVEISSELKKIISGYRKELNESGIRTESIYLYGSYARGTNDEDSDIDVIIVSPDFAKLNMRERLERLGIAAGRIMEPIEAFGFTPKEIEENDVGWFYSSILKKEAILIFSADSTKQEEIIK